MKEKIVLVIPVLPKYRHEFLQKVNERLKKSNKELIIITGTNNRKKEIKELTSKYSYQVIKEKTVGVKILNINLNWQVNLIKDTLSFKPKKVLIMLHTGKINYMILLFILKFSRIPYIIWGSGYKRVYLNSRLLRFKHFIKSIFEKTAYGYITYSNYFATQLIKKGYSKEKIIVAQNTIDVEKIIKNKSTIKIERNYELVRFLFVGALIKQKKLDKAITACKILSDKGYNFNFDIVGGGIIREDLELLINRYNLEEKVFIHGPKYGNEVIPFFERANVFLLPGTGGLAINEAMAHSLPIISTPGDGTVYDLVNIGINGFILEYNYSLEKLTSTMEYFIRSTPAKLKNMGNSSLMIIKEKGTMENMVDQFVKGIELFG